MDPHCKINKSPHNSRIDMHSKNKNVQQKKMVWLDLRFNFDYNKIQTDKYKAINLNKKNSVKNGGKKSGRKHNPSLCNYY